MISDTANEMIRQPDILRMNGICKRFPGVQALDRIDFDLKCGEVHAVLGENGAGKSTLIKIMCGDYRADGGEMIVDGASVHVHSPADAAAAGIYAIRQELSLVPSLSVAENIFLRRLPSRRFPIFVDWQRLYKDANEALGRLGVCFDVQMPVGRLSIAHQQVIEIAKALTVKARILILDEPTAALTDRETQRLFDVIRSLKVAGVGVVYISHRLDEVTELADRITVLRDGKKVATLDACRVNRGDVVRMMVGRELEEMYPKKPGKIGDVVLSVHGLAKSGVLEDIGFELHSGEILAIFGLMGSGRTELARALFGDLGIDAGQIRIKGKPISIRSPREACRQGIGLVPLDRRGEGLVLGMSVGRNITLTNLFAYNRIGFFMARQEQRNAQRWIKELKIRSTGQSQLTATLSGGNQQKVVVAKWLEFVAGILILNEPTRGIDVGAKVEIYQLLEDLCARGVGVIMMSSELPEVIAIADRTLVMSRGRVMGELSRSEATQEKLLHLAMRGGIESDKNCT